MTTEEKARAYDEALEKLKTMHDAWSNLEESYPAKDTVKDLEYYFPELKESEDERTRKALINIINLSYDCGIAITKGNRDKYIAWLEKHEKPKKVSIWKHWKDGIAGGAEGEQIFLTKIGRIYSISSCLGCECDYIELSELDKL